MISNCGGCNEIGRLFSKPCRHRVMFVRAPENCQYGIYLWLPGSAITDLLFLLEQHLPKKLPHYLPGLSLDLTHISSILTTSTLLQVWRPITGCLLPFPIAAPAGALQRSGVPGTAATAKPKPSWNTKPIHSLKISDIIAQRADTETKKQQKTRRRKVQLKQRREIQAEIASLLPAAYLDPRHERPDAFVSLLGAAIHYIESVTTPSLPSLVPEAVVPGELWHGKSETSEATGHSSTC